MIDTHTHLYEEAFDSDGGGIAAVDRAVEAGVSHMVLPNVDASTVGPLLSLCSRRPEILFPAMGLHPTSVDDGWRQQFGRIENILRGGGFVAVGEVGMDLYWDKTFRKQQQEVFAAQLALASELKLPVIVHCREALEDTLEVLRTHQGDMPRIVFHSFTLGKEEVRRIREVADVWFGINGVVTYKNAGALREAIPEIGIDRILLETDSPYLAPVPRRGRRNESALLCHIRDAVASAASLTASEVEKQTDANAVGFFSLSGAPPS